MKQIIVCKKICYYNVQNDTVTHIISDCYDKNLPDRALLDYIYNPNKMVWDISGGLWLRDSWIKVEVYNEYKEVKTILDKIKDWLIG